jgi:hypothetical protein
LNEQLGKQPSEAPGAIMPTSLHIPMPNPTLMKDEDTKKRRKLSKISAAVLDTPPESRTLDQANEVAQRTVVAGGKSYPTPIPPTNLFERLADVGPYNMIKSPTNSKPGWGAWARGDDATNVAGVPLAWLALPAALGTGYAGWTMADKLIDAWRKKKTKSKLDEAKAEFARLLGGVQKQSALDDPVGQLADLILEQKNVKKAADDAVAGAAPVAPSTGLGDKAWSVLGTPLGMYAALALLTGGFAGHASYNFFAKRDEQKIMEEAMRRRASQRSGGFLPQHVYLEDKSQYA